MGMMIKFLGILLSSFVFTGVLSLPFINFLYRMKFQRQDQKGSRDAFNQKTPIFSRLHAWKVGTPVGGGVLVVFSVGLFSSIFYTLTRFTINWTTIVIFFTFISFALLGFYDDIQKIFGYKKTGVWGMRLRHKFALQWILAFLTALLLFFKMDLSSLWLPLLGDFPLGIFYTLFAAFVIVSTVNAFNITDGLDGLAGGLLIIALCAFWVILSATGYGDAVLFVAVLVGSLLAFLYFNIHPARFWMGDTGAMAFGASLAVIALISQRVIVLPLVGGVFVVEVVSTLIQWGSRYFRRKKIFLSAPIHHHLEAIGWEEPKTVMRFWLVGAVLAFLGVFVAFL